MTDLVKLFLTIVGFFVPPDPVVTDWVPAGDPVLLAKVEKAMKELRVWHWKISGTVFLLCAAIIYIFGFAQFVRASDMNQVVAAQAQLATAINDQLAVSTADNICRLVNRRTKETDQNERWRLRQDIDALQNKYRTYMKSTQDYPEQRCNADG